VEERREGDPAEVVLDNALRKAEQGLNTAAGEAVALGVDTEVVLKGKVLGKPADAEAARQSLLALSGCAHTVISGVVLLHRNTAGKTRERNGVASSTVAFAELDRGAIARYVESGEWRDRAGGYAIQGLGSTLVDRVEGDFSNVVGLPLRLLIEMAPELFNGAGRGTSPRR
jgi:nucleoside triphosphate pyrophosphatase